MTTPYAFAAMLCLGPVWGQAAAERQTAAPYTVQYTIQEATDATSKSGRTYTTQVDNANTRSFIRTGTKVPYQTGAGQFNWADVGVNIDSRLQDRDGRLILFTSVELSSLVERSPMPLISQVRSETTTIVTAGKPLAVLTIDDPILQRKIRVEALVRAVP